MPVLAVIAAEVVKLRTMRRSGGIGLGLPKGRGPGGRRPGENRGRRARSGAEERFSSAIRDQSGGRSENVSWR